MNVLNVCHCDEVIAPIVYTVPLQLLSYYVALIKGTDVDQPETWLSQLQLNKEGPKGPFFGVH